MRTRVVNIKTKGKYDVYIGRANGSHEPFGNPFSVAEHGRDKALDLYRAYFYQRIATDPVFWKRIESLRGKRLGCYCKPYPCHGDIIVQFLEDNNGLVVA